MIKSQPILPIRFYDSLYDQDRFNKFHDRQLENHLIYPINALPSFQISRSHSVNNPTAFILKRVCNEDMYYKIIPEGASNFEPVGSNAFYADGFPRGGPGVYNNGVDPPFGTLHMPQVIIGECGGMMQGDLTDYTPTGSPVNADLVVPILNGFKHNVKIIVEKLINSSAGFSIKVYNGTTAGTLLGTITKAGIYNFNFTATSTDLTIEFDGLDANAGDEFNVSFLQVTHDALYQLSSDDVALTFADIQVFEKTEGGDIIAWCDNNQNLQVTPGLYYYIVQCADATYFSEIFKVVALKDIEKYYKLSWYNDCDIQHIIYNTTTLSCGFKNVLYLEAALFKPEYNTITENVTNGENTLIPTFKKWEKYITLEIIKTPEFLVDALSAIFLHDNVFLTEPRQREQVNLNDPIEILEVSSDIVPVLEDSFQRVNLKLLLADNYVKSSCCDNIEIES